MIKVIECVYNRKGIWIVPGASGTIQMPFLGSIRIILTTPMVRSNRKYSLASTSRAIDLNVTHISCDLGKNRSYLSYSPILILSIRYRYDIGDFYDK